MRVLGGWLGFRGGFRYLDGGILMDPHPQGLFVVGTGSEDDIWENLITAQPISQQ